MKKNESIKSIMSTNLITANTKTKISEVKGMMQDQKIHHVPIVSGDKIVGMVSRVDILRSSFSDLYTDNTADAQLDSMATIEDIMTRDIKTIRDSDTVRDAATILLGANFNSLPVIDNSEALVGVVTSKDIIRYLIEQY